MNTYSSEWNLILYLQYSTVYLLSCLRKCRYSVDLCILLHTSEYMHRPYLRLFHVPHDSVKLKEDFLKETVSQDFLLQFVSLFLFFRVFGNHISNVFLKNREDIHLPRLIAGVKRYCSKIHSPLLGDKVDNGIGLSHRPASLSSLTDRYDIPMP